MFVALDGYAIGMIAVADPIKDTSRLAIQSVQPWACASVMATGIAC